jgi:hypothetical protein
LGYITSPIPYFKVWVRKEFTHNHEKYTGEFIHGLATAVTCIPDRSLSFQIIFTGFEVDGSKKPNVFGGAMWARMPIQALVGDVLKLETFPDRMKAHLVQPWDCSSRTHSVFEIPRAKPSPWLAKIDGKFFKAKYIMTVDYSNSEVADDPSQHKQSHLLVLSEGVWQGNLVALPNNRVRVSSAAFWNLGEGAPDFRPSQHIHCAEEDYSYLDAEYTFNNIYAGKTNAKKKRS